MIVEEVYKMHIDEHLDAYKSTQCLLVTSPAPATKTGNAQVPWFVVDMYIYILYKLETEMY